MRFAFSISGERIIAICHLRFFNSGADLTDNYYPPKGDQAAKKKEAFTTHSQTRGKISTLPLYLLYRSTPIKLSIPLICIKSTDMCLSNIMMQNLTKVFAGYVKETVPHLVYPYRYPVLF